MVTDMMGRELEVGDWIVYLRTIGHRNHMALGMILSINGTKSISVEVKSVDGKPSKLKRPSTLLAFKKIFKLPCSEMDIAFFSLKNFER